MFIMASEVNIDCICRHQYPVQPTGSGHFVPIQHQTSTTTLTYLYAPTASLMYDTDSVVHETRKMCISNPLTCGYRTMNGIIQCSAPSTFSQQMSFLNFYLCVFIFI